MSERGYLSKIRFLIVDHNAFSRHLIRTILQQFGACDIHEAATGETAQEAAKSSPPDIVITGWHIKPVDGLEFTRWLREANNSPSPYVPVIMVTAHSQLSNVMQARDAGVNEFLAKPISAKSLLSRIQAVIDHPRQYVRTDAFFGPDRRRKRLPHREGERRRDLIAADNDDDIVDVGPGAGCAVP